MWYKVKTPLFKLSSNYSLAHGTHYKYIACIVLKSIRHSLSSSSFNEYLFSCFAFYSFLLNNPTINYHLNKRCLLYVFNSNSRSYAHVTYIC